MEEILAKNRKFLRAKAYGGIGNQLFILFALLNCCAKHNRKAVLDLNSIARHHHPGFYSIRDFEFDYLKVSFKISRLRNIRNKPFFSKTSAYLRRRLEKIGFGNGLNALSYGVFAGPEEIILSDRSKSINGYFCNLNHFLEFRNSHDIQALKVKNPSSNLSELFNSTDFEKSIAVHVRRGDTLILNDSVGNLSYKWYEQSIGILSAKKQIFNLFLFSDDKNILQEWRHRLASSGIHKVSVVTSLDSPCEELSFMSHFKYFVIPNSSYSTWAAMFSGRDSTVVYPEPWNINQINAPLGLPDNWIKSPSIWG